MINVAVVFFVLAALSGLYLVSQVLSKGENPPTAAALAHGAMAVAGFLILGLFVLQNGFPKLYTVSAGILTVAALGGLLLFTKHLKKQVLPLGLIIVHALAAVIGVVVFVTALLQ